jgi:uncharacterized membrane protein
MTDLPTQETPKSGAEEPSPFDVVLQPYRSLGPIGFVVLMAAIALAGAATGTVFFLIGAWPIPGFIGLDVVLVYIAFRVNYRRARSWERVRLTRAELVIERGAPDGRVRRWTFQPYWLRVEIDEPVRPGSRLTLTSHGKRLEIGAFLPPEERLAFANSLRAALARLKEAPGAG